LNKALADWIDDVHEHDGDCLGCRLQCFQYRGAVSNQDVRRQRHQLRRGLLLLDVVLCQTIIDPEIAPVGPSQLLQPQQERSHANWCLGITGGKAHQHADPTQPLVLLRASRQRPCHAHPTENSDELSPTNIGSLNEHESLHRLERGCSITPYTLANCVLHSTP